jgi:hypothetical protein
MSDVREVGPVVPVWPAREVDPGKERRQRTPKRDRRESGESADAPHERPEGTLDEYA